MTYLVMAEFTREMSCMLCALGGVGVCYKMSLGFIRLDFVLNTPLIFGSIIHFCTSTDNEYIKLLPNSDR